MDVGRGISLLSKDGNLHVFYDVSWTLYLGHIVTNHGSPRLYQATHIDGIGDSVPNRGGVWSSVKNWGLRPTAIIDSNGYIQVYYEMNDQTRLGSL